MGEILISFDYGRRAEYLTSFALSPYAITVPIRGHDDRVESDFLCVGFEEENKSFIPNVQTEWGSDQANAKDCMRSEAHFDRFLGDALPSFIPHTIWLN